MMLKQAAKNLGVSIFTISYWLRKLGYSYKKKDFSYLEEGETKRNEYKEIIENIPSEKLVYIDESGIEMTICKDRGWGERRVKN